jgi:DNA-binding HxlR family transcriptional regulator
LQQRRSDKQGEEKSITDFKLAMMLPQVSFMNCPIKTSLGVLGKKWSMLIIRDIGVYKITRFNRLLESIEGITPRVLSLRLKELEKKGFIERDEDFGAAGRIWF